MGQSQHGGESGAKFVVMHQLAYAELDEHHAYEKSHEQASHIGV